MMSATVDQALQLWGFEGAGYTLVAARENAVYKISHQGRPFALRLHRQGYRTDAQLTSELQWMAAAAQGGLSTPAPIRSATGALLHTVDGIQIDVLTWLSGTTLEEADPNAAQFHQLGQNMARLHDLSDAWTPPANFTRDAWDRNGLLGPAPLWDRFWENPMLTPQEQALFKALRAKADDTLATLEETLDYGLIHADLIPANVMVDGAQMHLIDFDDGGYGFRLFDLATTLLKTQGNPEQSKALIDGYTSQRQIDLSALDLFITLRAMTYVGWNITRMDHKDARPRNERFISTAKRLATDFMDR